MRNVVLAILLALAVGAEAVSKVAAKSSTARAGSASRGGRRISVSLGRPTATQTAAQSPGDSFAGCMDGVCVSEDAADKGRCRCSSQLVRIDKTLRDIDRAQRQADDEGKQLEILMNAVNTAKVNDALDNIYENIGSVENRAKMLASQRLDGKTLVMEGLPLYEEALKLCSPWLDKESENDAKEKRKQEYLVMVEKDCGAYTTVLKEKADAVSSLLAQTQKNREMFDEQEYKKRNQLDQKACYAEYEACIKAQCGVNFRDCKQKAKSAAAVTKCEAINYGKCEDYKYAVLRDIQKLLKNEVVKDDLAVTCLAALGHMEKGKCMFRVLYVADSCQAFTSACDNSQEVWAMPGQSFNCDDSSFKNVSSGCGNSCYLIGPNGEKVKLGNNSGMDFFGAGGNCSGDSFQVPNAPKGWGNDGYPKDAQYKGVLI